MGYNSGFKGLIDFVLTSPADVSQKTVFLLAHCQPKVLVLRVPRYLQGKQVAISHHYVFPHVVTGSTFSVGRTG